MSETNFTEADGGHPVLEALRQAGIRPRGVQKSAIEVGLLDGRSVLVCSPTGSGKTLVGEMALMRAYLEGQKGMYLVPLRALGVQVMMSLRDRYRDSGLRVGLSTGDYHLPGDDLSSNDVVVATYERADSLLRHRASWLGELGTVVVDECQNIGDEQRGARLESTIMRLRMINPSVQIVALSATIASPNELADWLQCELVESKERPVPLHYSVLPVSDRARAIQELVMTTVQSNGQALVFNRTRREAEAEAERLSAHVVRQMTSSERQAVDRELDSIENFGVTVPPRLRALLHNGVAYHHAGLTATTRRLVEQLFLRGHVRLVSATTTLAAGMDLPARTVIVPSLVAPGTSRRMLSANQLHQMLGRAGRPSRDKTGFGVILAGSRGEADYIVRRYFRLRPDPATGNQVLEPVYDPVDSRMSDSRSLVEQMLVFIDHLGEISLESFETDVLPSTYASYVSGGRRTPSKLFQLSAITAEDAIHHHATSDTLAAVRDGRYGTVSVREKREVVLGGMVQVPGGGQYTCRFSAQSSPDGVLEGPMCSCGHAISDDGLLCEHLVALALHLSRMDRASADYIIPLSLGEISPYDTLVRLGLIEGGREGRLRATPLGRMVNRLYLKIETVRELLALLPTVSGGSDLLELLRHVYAVESGQVEESIDAIVGTIASSDSSVRSVADQVELPEGDVMIILERCRWLLYSIGALSELGGLKHIAAMATGLRKAIERRLSEEVRSEDGF